MPVSGGLGGFRLPILSDITNPPPVVGGGLLTGTNIVTKTVAPQLAGKLTGLAMLGGGALAGYLLGGMGGGQEQQQEAAIVQQTQQTPTQDVIHNMTFAPVTNTRTYETSNQYYNAGGDIYGAPVEFHTSVIPSVSAAQYTGQDTSSGSSGSQEQGQEATSMDMTGLIILGAVAIGAYFLLGRKE